MFIDRQVEKFVEEFGAHPADLWDKFLSLAKFSGGADITKDRLHLHVGFILQEKDPFVQEKVLPLLIDVLPDNIHPAKTMNFFALLNCEEIRQVGWNGWTFTNTYNGSHGLREWSYEQTRNWKGFVKTLINYEKLLDEYSKTI